LALNHPPSINYFIFGTQPLSAFYQKMTFISMTGRCQYLIQLILFGRLVELFKGKDRPVLADQFPSDITAAAHPDAALHAVFKGHDNLIMGIAQLV
jgi:hypothetical protein